MLPMVNRKQALGGSHNPVLRHLFPSVLLRLVASPENKVAMQIASLTPDVLNMGEGHMGPSLGFNKIMSLVYLEYYRKPPTHSKGL